MSKKLLLVTSANTGEEALSNAKKFMVEFERFVDSIEIHGAIAIDDEIYVNPDCSYDNIFKDEVKSFTDMKNISLEIASQHLNYEAMFEIVKKGNLQLEWITWYGASKYCILLAELNSQSILEPEKFDILEHELFPVDFSLHQVAHYSYCRSGLDDRTWIVVIDVKL
jgi:hypothetical protein